MLRFGRPHATPPPPTGPSIPHSHTVSPWNHSAPWVTHAAAGQSNLGAHANTKIQPMQRGHNQRIPPQLHAACPESKLLNYDTMNYSVRTSSAVPQMRGNIPCDIQTEPRTFSTRCVIPETIRVPHHTHAPTCPTLPRTTHSVSLTSRAPGRLLCAGAIGINLLLVPRAHNLVNDTVYCW